MPRKDKTEQAAYYKAWKKTDRGKRVRAKSNKKYASSEKGKLQNRLGTDRHRQTLKGHISSIWYTLTRCNPDMLFKTRIEFLDYVINVMKEDPRDARIAKIFKSQPYGPGNVQFIRSYSDMNKG